MHLNHHWKEGPLPFVYFWQLENTLVEVDKGGIKVGVFFTKKPHKNGCVVDEGFSLEIVYRLLKIFVRRWGFFEPKIRLQRQSFPVLESVKSETLHVAEAVEFVALALLWKILSVFSDSR